MYARILTIILPLAFSAAAGATQVQVSPKNLDSLVALQLRADGDFDVICADQSHEVASQIQLLLGSVCPAEPVPPSNILSVQRLQSGEFSVICRDLQRKTVAKEEILNGSVCAGSFVGEKLGSQGGRNYFKVQASGKMTDETVRATCSKAGMRTPCTNGRGGQFSDELCEDVGWRDGGNPMRTLSYEICSGQSPSNCDPLEGVFQYMGQKWDNYGACGVVNGGWCAYGSQHSDKFALCVQ